MTEFGAHAWLPSLALILLAGIVMLLLGKRMVPVTVLLRMFWEILAFKPSRVWTIPWDAVYSFVYRKRLSDVPLPPCPEPFPDRGWRQCHRQVGPAVHLGVNGKTVWQHGTVMTYAAVERIVRHGEAHQSTALFMMYSDLHGRISDSDLDQCLRDFGMEDATCRNISSTVTAAIVLGPCSRGEHPPRTNCGSQPEVEVVS